MGGLAAASDGVGTKGKGQRTGRCVVGTVAAKEMDILDPAVRAVLSGLRDSGHAVVVFTPDELNGARPNKTEDHMVSKGWEFIECWSEHDAEGG